MNAHPSKYRGFTLVEVLVAMTIATIVAGVVVSLVAVPVNSYVDQSQRAELNDGASKIANSLTADLRRALPNSVSISNAGSRSIIEMVLVENSVTYRSTAETGDATIGLDFTPTTETTFSVTGYLLPNAGVSYNVTNLVVGNLGRGTAADVYRPTLNPGVITPNGRTITVARDVVAHTEAVTITPGVRFRNPGLSGRMYAVLTPVTYVCNSAANARTLRRYSNYALTATRPTSEASAQLNQAGVTNMVVANAVSSCRVRCRTGAATENVCADTLVVQIGLDRPGASGNPDTLRTHLQFPVDNNP